MNAETKLQEEKNGGRWTIFCGSRKEFAKRLRKNRNEFIELGHRVLHEPETAFSEFKTAEKYSRLFQNLVFPAGRDRRLPA